VLGCRALGLFVTPELALYDQLLGWRAAAQRPAPAPVVLVGATEEDLGRYGWPLTDERLAQLLEAILAQGPRAVGVDLYRDLPLPPGEARLARLLSTSANVFGVTKLASDGARTIAAHPALRATPRVGFADVVVDPGGVVRRGLLYLEDNGRNYSAFGLLLALKYLEAQGIRPAQAEGGALRLGQAVIPPFEADDGGYVGADAAGYQFLLDYLSGATPFARVSVAELLEARAPAGLLRDKVVIVGVTAESVKDFFYTPFRGGAQAEEIVHGIAMHGHLVDQLLRFAEGRTPPMRVFAESAELAWIAFWTLLGTAAGFALRDPRLLIAALLAGLAAIGAASAFALARYWWLPALPQAAGWLLAVGGVTGYLSWRERMQRGQLMQLFSRHISGDIAEDIWNRREEFLGGDGQPRRQRLSASVLFSDIRGFTTVSERLEPQALMDWLSRYMSAMTDVVRRERGTVNLLIGDAVMAVFGIPIARLAQEEIRADAVAAVDCALGMAEALKAVNLDNEARGLPKIGIRVGVHSGPLVTGSLGSRERAQYTVIGDTVNVASRLESFKTSGAAAPVFEEEDCRILVSEQTLQLTGARYRVKPVGEVQLKGKERGVTVFKVEGFAEGVQPATGGSR
jgi:adenylate cyclase